MRVFLFFCLLAVSGMVYAVDVIVPVPKCFNCSIRLRVGSPGNVISNVEFDVMARDLGNGTEIAGTPSIEVEVEVGGLFGFFFNETVVLSVDSSLPLTASGNTIPFTQIRWESSDPSDFPSGQFAGTAGQEIYTLFCPGFRCRDTTFDALLTFYYLNSVPKPAGTYSGRVTYTLAEP